MREGECIKQDVVLIVDDPNAVPGSPDILDESIEKCEFVLPVFASTSDTDDLKNDRTSVYQGFSNQVASVVMRLFKCDEEQTTLVDDTYGTFYDLAFHEDNGKSYMGYLIDWREVLSAFGTGEYYVRFESTDILGNVNNIDSFTYCLDNYGTAKANKTVRIEFTQNGITGNRIKDRETISYRGINWYNQVRLPQAYFSIPTAEYEIERVRYTTGQEVDTKLEQTPKYELLIYPIPYSLHRYLQVDVLTADEILITDYNSLNPMKTVVSEIIKKNVMFVGNYEPNWLGRGNKASVTLTFEQRFNNLRKVRC